MRDEVSVASGDRLREDRRTLGLNPLLLRKGLAAWRLSHSLSSPLGLLHHLLLFFFFRVLQCRTIINQQYIYICTPISSTNIWSMLKLLLKIKQLQYFVVIIWCWIFYFITQNLKLSKKFPLFGVSIRSYLFTKNINFHWGLWHSKWFSTERVNFQIGRKGELTESDFWNMDTRRGGHSNCQEGRIYWTEF